MEKRANKDHFLVCVSLTSGGKVAIVEFRTISLKPASAAASGTPCVCAGGGVVGLLAIEAGFDLRFFEMAASSTTVAVSEGL